MPLCGFDDENDVYSAISDAGRNPQNWRREFRKIEGKRFFEDRKLKRISAPMCYH